MTKPKPTTNRLIKHCGVPVSISKAVSQETPLEAEHGITGKLLAAIFLAQRNRQVEQSVLDSNPHLTTKWRDQTQQ